MKNINKTLLFTFTCATLIQPVTSFGMFNKFKQFPKLWRYNTLRRYNFKQKFTKTFNHGKVLAENMQLKKEIKMLKEIQAPQNSFKQKMGTATKGITLSLLAYFTPTNNIFGWAKYYCKKLGSVIIKQNFFKKK